MNEEGTVLVAGKTRALAQEEVTAGRHYAWRPVIRCEKRLLHRTQMRRNQLVWAPEAADAPPTGCWRRHPSSGDGDGDGRADSAPDTIQSDTVSPLEPTHRSAGQTNLFFPII